MSYTALHMQLERITGLSLSLPSALICKRACNDGNLTVLLKFILLNLSVMFVFITFKHNSN